MSPALRFAVDINCRRFDFRREHSLFFLKHFSGPESGILEFDWLLTRVPPVQFFYPDHPDRFCYGNRAN